MDINYIVSVCPYKRCQDSVEFISAAIDKKWSISTLQNNLHGPCFEDYFDELYKHYEYDILGFSIAPRSIDPININSKRGFIISKIKRVLEKYGHLSIGVFINALQHGFILYKIKGSDGIYIIDSYINFRKAEIRKFDDWENMMTTLFSGNFNLEWWNNVFKANEVEEPKSKAITTFEFTYYTGRKGYLKLNDQIVDLH